MALAAALYGVIILAVAAWLLRHHVNFYLRFEPLGRNAQGLREYRHRDTGLVFVRIPAGAFVMGTPTEEAGALIAERLRGDGPPDSASVSLRRSLETEQPPHEVRVSEFLIAKHEVTQGLWERTGRPLNVRSREGTVPVVLVSWEECRDFCGSLGLELPTEAQWERACRAGTTGRYGGTGDLDALGWYARNSGNAPRPVGTKAPNDFGLHDLHGNVAEYCADGFRADFYASCGPVSIDPVCLDAGSGRVARGGSWLDAAEDCRSASRERIADPKRGDLETGFRPVFSALPYPIP